ncbi:hypothetical protein BCR33DRAFT_719131 [Rhizoclosmatium globosum]|uniref:Mitochondrial DNA polymerase catalytic subunit n=1 Tax=Rhizoclosmatium globosum TaxID=329046 RepID=A0A1Y2C1X2_9FUNG|nr:hypothetical protein BCR33DRAFT_719131 [Rhizoclosmatium globosum]|eukprot:ORY41038.1 hypothetical protein BCR33DRAFT_719131 [Rhizoclosmatium globosum]
MLPPFLHSQLFPSPSPPPPEFAASLSKRLLSAFDLLGKQEPPISDVALALPQLASNSLESHFRVIGTDAAEPFRTLTSHLAAASLPARPKTWSKSAGWTRYNSDGSATNVPFPECKALVFDIENMWAVSPFAIMAVAASENFWYSWVSPELADLVSPPKSNKRRTKIAASPISDSVEFKTLIPLGLNDSTPRVIVGHNVSYDRARVLEEYSSLNENKVAWIDTLSLHSAVGGLSSQQRAAWMQYKKAAADLESTKEDISDDLTPTEKYDKLTDKLGTVTGYKKDWMEVGSMNSLKHVAKLYLNKDISKDPRAVFESGDITQVVENFDTLMEYCATDVSTTHEILAVMGKCFLPTTNDWFDYMDRSEKVCEEHSQFTEKTFLELAESALELRHKEKWKENEWLRRLDWTPCSTRGKIFPGYPMWYRELWDSKAKAIKITSSKRIAPYLLQLSWRSFPMYYNKAKGWMYREPAVDLKDSVRPSLTKEELETHKFYKIPHKDGEEENCGNPLSKSYITHFESGLLGSKYPTANEILTRKAMCSYWVSNRSRIQSQFAVQTTSFTDNNNKPGYIILPQMVAMGTVTRRAVESTWLTASNAKKTRVGSELKTLIRAPPGYSFVGADVDSEELWICSLLGDAQFGIHGATPVGFMTLQGSKSKGTDLHTVTGRIVGISRDVAKIFNYSRLYGAGARHSTQLLLQHAPGVEKEEAAAKIKRLFAETKGVKCKAVGGWKDVWVGGSESFVFNALEGIANSECPRTPVLGCEIPDSLMPKVVKSDFSTSRVNWVVTTKYLFRRFKIKGRFMISIHDEVRYMVAKEHEDLAALALQISNLWTRALFASRVGIDDLPLNIAFFSAVDIDHCLRKEVDQSCITPTNTEAIPNGRNATIYDTLAAVQALVPNGDLNALYGEELESWKRMIKNVKRRDMDRTWLEVQMCKSSAEARKLVESEKPSTKWDMWKDTPRQVICEADPSLPQKELPQDLAEASPLSTQPQVKKSYSQGKPKDTGSKPIKPVYRRKEQEESEIEVSVLEGIQAVAMPRRRQGTFSAPRRKPGIE